MNFSKVTAEVASDFIAKQITIKTGWQDPIEALILAKKFSCTHNNVVYNGVHTRRFVGMQDLFVEFVQHTLGVYTPYHAYEIAELLQMKLHEKIIEANKRLFSQETLDFIGSHSDEEVGLWIASKMEEWSGGAHWCADCGKRRQFEAKIDAIELFYNQCPQHTYKMERNLPYHLPANMRERSHPIAYYAKTAIEEKMFGPATFSGRACLSEVRKKIESELHTY